MRLWQAPGCLGTPAWGPGRRPQPEPRRPAWRAYALAVGTGLVLPTVLLVGWIRACG